MATLKTYKSRTRPWAVPVGEAGTTASSSIAPEGGLGAGLEAVVAAVASIGGKEEDEAGVRALKSRKRGRTTFQVPLVQHRQSQSVCTALELTEAGHSRAKLDSLTYLLDGTGSRDVDAAMGCALAFARECKSASQRNVARAGGLGVELASAMEAALSAGRDAVCFILTVAMYHLCGEDAASVGTAAVAPLARQLIEQLKPLSKRRGREGSAVIAQSGESARGSSFRSKLKMKGGPNGPRREPRHQFSSTNSQGEPDALTRAKGQLDRSEVLSWGFANRQAVTAGDLSLQALTRLLSAGGGAAIQAELRSTGVLDTVAGVLCSEGGKEAQALACLRLIELATHDSTANASHLARGCNGHDLMQALCRIIHQRAAGLISPDVPVAKESVGGSSISREHLLAALRVSVNLTHHNPEACDGLSGGEGLAALLGCFLADDDQQQERAIEATHDQEYDYFDDGDESLNLSQGSCSRSSFKDFAAGKDSSPQAQAESSHGAINAVRPAAQAGGAFDIQVLALTALTNCVELKTSSVHRKKLMSYRICSRCPQHSTPLVLRDESDVQHSSSISTVQYLIGFLADRTRSFEAQMHSENIKNASAAEEAAATDSMTQAEVEDLVMAGHCSLLLGCIAVGDDETREAVSQLMPGETLAPIVQVLHAFLAMQQQAEVLSTDVAVPILTLIKDLEGDDPAEEADETDGHLKVAEWSSGRDRTAKPKTYSSRPQPLSGSEVLCSMSSSGRQIFTSPRGPSLLDAVKRSC